MDIDAACGQLVTAEKTKMIRSSEEINQVVQESVFLSFKLIKVRPFLIIIKNPNPNIQIIELRWFSIEKAKDKFGSKLFNLVSVISKQI